MDEKMTEEENKALEDFEDMVDEYAQGTTQDFADHVDEMKKQLAKVPTDAALKKRGDE